MIEELTSFEIKKIFGDDLKPSTYKLLYDLILDLQKQFSQLGIDNDTFKAQVRASITDKIKLELDNLLATGQLQEIISNELNEKLAEVREARGTFPKLKNRIESIDNSLTNVNNLVNEILPQIELNVMSISGVKGDGINDDGHIISEFINNSSGNIKLKFNGNKIFKGNIEIVNKRNITLFGNCTILGTVKFIYDTPTYTNNKVINITIQPYETRQNYTDVTLNCVYLENCRQIKFDNCVFRYGLCGIKLADIQSRKHSGCMIINSCTFDNCNYDLYAYNDNYGEYLLMDTTITNSQSYSCRINSIYVKNADGLILSNNTFFMAGHTIGEKQKKNNILINGANFVIINNNNLFEAGEEAIKISNFQNTVITGNNIAWCGQCKLSAGIKLISTGASNSAKESLVRANINNNNIENSSLYGIEIYGYFQGLNIQSNSIMMNTGTYYYGDETYDVKNVRAIKLYEEYAKSSSIVIANNNYYYNIDDIGNYRNVKVINNLSKNGIINRGYRIESFTDSKWSNTSLNLTDNTVFSINDILVIPEERTANLNIQSIGVAIEFKTIKIINLNATKEIKITNNHTTATYPMVLKGNTTVTLGKNESRSFMFYKNIWIEI